MMTRPDSDSEGQPTAVLHDRVAELITLLHAQDAKDSAQQAIPDLRRLHDEIERWTETEDASDDSWIERLRHLIEQLEIDHPQTTHVIGRISHSLAELGI
jgi:hypothetical protein